MYPREYQFPEFRDPEKKAKGQPQVDEVRCYLIGLRDGGVVDSFDIRNNGNGTLYAALMMRCDFPVEHRIADRFRNNFNGERKLI